MFLGVVLDHLLEVLVEKLEPVVALDVVGWLKLMVHLLGNFIRKCHSSIQNLAEPQVEVSVAEGNHQKHC